MKELHDLTDELKADHIDWTAAPPKVFRAQFSAGARAIKVGLYAGIHVNESRYPIFDRNGAGKEIIRAADASGPAAALKYGKFQNGVLGRNQQNFTHFHRRAEAGEEADIFPEVLRTLLVLDLTPYEIGDVNTAAYFERYWNRSIEAQLKAQDLLAEGASESRSESRGIRRPLNHRELTELVSPIAARVLGAARALHVP